VGVTPQVLIDPSPKFSGTFSFAGGNSYEKHPSMPWNSPGWFLDQLPLIGGNSFDNASPGATKLSGDLYKYYYDGLDKPGFDSGDGLSRKQSPTAAFCGTNLLKDISGPGSTIGPDTASAFTYCVSGQAGECVNGSLAGDIYVNCPNIQTPYCTQNEFYGGERDICIADMPALGISVSQFLIQNDPTGKSQRTLLRLFAERGWGSTSNTKPLPDASWTMFFPNRSKSAKRRLPGESAAGEAG